MKKAFGLQEFLIVIGIIAMIAITITVLVSGPNKGSTVYFDNTEYTVVGYDYHNCNVSLYNSKTKQTIWVDKSLVQEK